MDNLKIYNEVRKVPQEAQKSIGGGRLKGMTDINPMWRIKELTRQFGICGIGWYYKIVNKHLEKCESTQEISAFVDIELFIKVNGEWSMPIVGTGGASFIAKEKAGLYVSDECFKMALTDAISVACKALGFGADVYWNKDRESKYSTVPKEEEQLPKQDWKESLNIPPEWQGKVVEVAVISEAQAKRLFAVSKGNNELVRQILLKYGFTSSKSVTKDKYNQICQEIENGGK